MRIYCCSSSQAWHTVGTDLGEGFTYGVVPVCGSYAWLRTKRIVLSSMPAMASGSQPAWDFLYVKPESLATWEP